MVNPSHHATRWPEAGGCFSGAKLGWEPVTPPRLSARSGLLREDGGHACGTRAAYTLSRGRLPKCTTPWPPPPLVPPPRSRRTPRSAYTCCWRSRWVGGAAAGRARDWGTGGHHGRRCGALYSSPADWRWQIRRLQVARTPDRIAVVDGETQLTYRQFNDLADVLALRCGA